MNKKSVIASQVSWIFILVAGAVILIFFVSVAQKQRSISEQSISADVTKDITSIINGAVSGEKTESLIDIPNIKLNLGCDDYRIGSATEYFGSIVAFSPDLIKGFYMIAYARDWELPFKATNFLYLTGEQVRYILVYDENDAESKKMMEDINEILPEKIDKEVVDIDNLPFIEDKNNYKVRFVFFTDPINLPDLPKTRDKDLTSVEIIQEETYDYGTIKFYQGKNNIPKGQSYYIKKESLIGAIFSENKENYECSMKKAFKNLNLLSQIYTDRTFSLINYYPEGSVCRSKLEDTTTTLGNIRIVSGQLSNNIDLSRISDIYGDAYEINMGLEHKNDVLKYHSCPLIY